MQGLVLGGAPHAVVVLGFVPSTEAFSDAIDVAREVMKDPGASHVQIRMLSGPTHPFICWWARNKQGDWRVRDLPDWDLTRIKDWREQLVAYERSHRLAPGELTTAA